jgi:hypothetical protein
MSQNPPQISILASDDIDRQKWDACVQGDGHALIYSQSWYLDLMAERWYGLVAGDYQTVMPLPVKSVAGIRIIYTPPFFQRLDIAGICDDAIKQEISKKILSFSKLVSLNTATEGLFKDAEIKVKTNYVLNLNRPHTDIAEAYTKECKKNIIKAVNRGCELSEDIGIDEVITFYQLAYGEKAAYKKKHFDRLAAMMKNLSIQFNVHLMGVKDKTSGDLIFAAALLDDGKRIYYLLGAPSAEGRKARATAFFLDQVISLFATKRSVFDFEGSDITDVASFYKSFNPEAEQYYRYYSNNFMQPVKAVLDKLLK